MWIIRLEFWMNVLPQKSQLKGLSPVWILTCRISQCLSSNSLLHFKHLNAFWPLWLSYTCCLSKESFINPLPQNLQDISSLGGCSKSTYTSMLWLWSGDEEPSVVGSVKSVVFQASASISGLMYWCSGSSLICIFSWKCVPSRLENCSTFMLHCCSDGMNFSEILCVSKGEKGQVLWI